MRSVVPREGLLFSVSALRLSGVEMREWHETYHAAPRFALPRRICGTGRVSIAVDRVVEVEEAVTREGIDFQADARHAGQDRNIGGSRGGAVRS